MWVNRHCLTDLDNQLERLYSLIFHYGGAAEPPSESTLPPLFPSTRSPSPFPPATASGARIAHGVP